MQKHTKANAESEMHLADLDKQASNRSLAGEIHSAQQPQQANKAYASFRK